MNHAHSGAVVYSDGKKCFISTAASHKAQRPREEVIIIEDNIIWFNQWKCNNIHGWLHINLSLYSYWCTTLNFHDLCLHRNSTQRPVYVIAVWPSAEPCMTAQVRIAVGQLCCHITGETLMRGKSVRPKGIKGNLSSLSTCCWAVFLLTASLAKRDIWVISVCWYYFPLTSIRAQWISGMGRSAHCNFWNNFTDGGKGGGRQTGCKSYRIIKS